MRSRNIPFIRKILTGAAVIFSLLSPGRAFAVFGDSTDKEIILVIASYNPDTKRMTNFISEFEDRIAREKLPYEIVIEDMGCKEFSEAPLWSGSMHSIIERYKERTQAFILLGQEAWAAFLSQPDIPDSIPFFGCYASRNGILLPGKDDTITQNWTPESVDMEEIAAQRGISGGTLNQYDVAKNIDLILSFYPETENIAFVSDNTYGGISLQSMVRKEFGNYSDLNLIMIDTRDGNDRADNMIADLPHNSAILVGTWRVGQNGEYLMLRSMEDLVKNNPAIPVFSLTGSGIGSIAIGGYVPKYRSGAMVIAEQLSEYYKGNRDQVGFLSTEGEYRFDKSKLKEFNIAEYKLPQGSIVEDDLNVQIKKYRSYIYMSVLGLAVLSMIILYIYFLYLKNKKLKNELIIREHELIVAKDKAEESDRLKSAFLANMSHEIRTPLNAIVGFSTLMADKDTTQEEKDEYNHIVSTNSSLLLTLIGDILDLSRLETGKTTFNYEEVDIVGLCRQVLPSAISHNRKEKVDYRFESSLESYMLRTDVQRLSQVLINLLTNANKFTESGSITLAFEVREDDGMVVFSVTDTGCGIPREKQDKVFNRFEKLNEFKQGTGLGLHICMQIVTKFGGRIQVDPTYTGGTRFVFTHPVHPPEDGK